MNCSLHDDAFDLVRDPGSSTVTVWVVKLSLSRQWPNGPVFRCGPSQVPRLPAFAKSIVVETKKDPLRALDIVAGGGVAPLRPAFRSP